MTRQIWEIKATPDECLDRLVAAVDAAPQEELLEVSKVGKENVTTYPFIGTVLGVYHRHGLQQYIVCCFSGILSWGILNSKSCVIVAMAH